MDAIVEERWREERRDRILQAATRVFDRLSYGRASMDGIAHEAGFGKPTLYRYFASKEALFAAVFVQALDDLEARLAAALDGDAPLADQLTALVAEIAPMFRDHLVSRRLVGGDVAALDLSKRRIFRERRARIERVLASAIEAGMARGEARHGDCSLLAQFVIGMIWSATASSDAGAVDITRAVVDFAMTGLLPRERQATSGPENLSMSLPERTAA